MDLARSLVLGVIVLGACRPLDYENLSETDIVATVSDERDFSGYRTYALIDVVADLESCDSPRDVDHTALDPVLLSTIDFDLGDLGWTSVADPADPTVDMVVVAGVVACDNWYWAWDPGWWDWWWYYPPTYVPVNYPEGTVVVTMFAPSELTFDSSGNPQVPVAWAAAISGLLSGTRYDLDRLADNIDQAFAQSPYLEVGP